MNILIIFEQFANICLVRLQIKLDTENPPSRLHAPVQNVPTSHSVSFTQGTTSFTEEAPPGCGINLSLHLESMLKKE
jgi:hypothetical protein